MSADLTSRLMLVCPRLQRPSRAELSALMNRWSPALAASNDRDRKWKKSLCKQLCECEEISICRSPGCAVCGD